MRSPRTLSLTFATAAPATGTVVDLKGELRGGVRLPNQVFVPAGYRSAPVDAFIDANFVGAVHLTAAAGGVTRALDLVVHPHGDCD